MNIKSIGGEFSLIKRLMQGIVPKKEVLVGIGDDCAVLKYTKDQYQLITTDNLVENVHFRRNWSTPKQIGKKAIEVNVSDIASMGGIPKHVVLALTIQKNEKVDFIDKLWAGIKTECKKYEIQIVGGNITSGKELNIGVTLTGVVTKKNLTLRSNAKQENLICVTGRLGKGFAGYMLCKQKRKKLAKPFLEPTSQLKKSKAISQYATSMIDISDSLASEIHHICKASSVGAVIEKNKIPIHPLTNKVKGDPHKIALYSGDEYELLFTVSEKDVKKIKTPFSIIGKVTKNKSVKLIDGKKEYAIRKGFDHFL